jgi:undecaprenyl phosphate N,N'-diacetylbacillosamine 1-phosphate transferase
MYKKFVKRSLDVILALMGLPFFILIFIVLAPILYLEDRGSVFYKANRLGLNGRVFKMYKFRTMKTNAPDIRNADGSTFNSKDDPRLTKIGKFMRKTSLDETPQLLNIIRGEMSAGDCIEIPYIVGGRRIDATYSALTKRPPRIFESL